MKKDILINLKKSQEKLIKNLIEELGNLEIGADIDQDDVVDPEDISHKVEANEMEVLLSEQLKSAKKDLTFITNNLDTECSQVQSGALVYTDKYLFFIGVATIPITYKEFTLLGISLKAPIYSLLNNKKKGDSFSFAAHDYNIINIE
jgi:hypothetical protein